MNRRLDRRRRRTLTFSISEGGGDLRVLLARLRIVFSRRDRRQALAGRLWKRVLLRRVISGSQLRRLRTAAGRALVIHYLAQAAAFKEDVLSGHQSIASAAE